MHNVVEAIESLKVELAEIRAELAKLKSNLAKVAEGIDKALEGRYLSQFWFSGASYIPDWGTVQNATFPPKTLRTSWELATHMAGLAKPAAGFRVLTVDVTTEDGKTNTIRVY